MSKKPLLARKQRRLQLEDPAPLWALSVRHLWSGEGPRTRAPVGVGCFKGGDCQTGNVDATTGQLATGKVAGKRSDKENSKNLFD